MIKSRGASRDLHLERWDQRPSVLFIGFLIWNGISTVDDEYLLRSYRSPEQAVNEQLIFRKLH